MGHESSKFGLRPVDCLANPTIHLVDDDDAVRDSMRALLESYGMDVRDYVSGEEFLSGEKKERSCLLLDMHMPGLNGIEVLESMRRCGSSLPVIVVSGRSDPGLKERAMRAGALALFEKPVNDALLLAALNRAFIAAAA